MIVFQALLSHSPFIISIENYFLSSWLCVVWISFSCLWSFSSFLCHGDGCPSCLWLLLSLLHFQREISTERKGVNILDAQVNVRCYVGQFKLWSWRKQYFLYSRRRKQKGREKDRTQSPTRRCEHLVSCSLLSFTNK